MPAGHWNKFQETLVPDKPLRCRVCRDLRDEFTVPEPLATLVHCSQDLEALLYPIVSLQPLAPRGYITIHWSCEGGEATYTPHTKPIETLNLPTDLYPSTRIHPPCQDATSSAGATGVK